MAEIMSSLSDTLPLNFLIRINLVGLPVPGVSFKKLTTAQLKSVSLR